MTESYIDSLLEQLKGDLIQHTPPSARYDKKFKTITVLYDFCHGFIEKVKIIAPREQWLKWENFDQISFKEVGPFLTQRTSKDNRQALKEYADRYPKDFIGDMIACMQCANFENPLYYPARKPRGGSRYRHFDDRYSDWKEMWEIRNTARHLYIFLKYQLGQPRNMRSPIFQQCLQRYDIPQSLHNYPTGITMEIINQAYPNLEIDEIDDPRTFYNKYIAYLPISRLKRSNRIKSGDSPFINKILS